MERNNPMQTKTVNIPNISCGHCVHTIQSEVSELAGVTKVEASQENKMVTVEWQDPATWDEIKTLLAEINYPVAE
jgi:copper chaperone